MALSVPSSLSNFITSLVGAAASIINSILSLFQAILALGWNTIESVMTVAKHFIAMFIDLFHGILGFLTANFLAIMIIAIGYWVYTTQTGRGSGVMKKTR